MRVRRIALLRIALLMLCTSIATANAATGAEPSPSNSALVIEAHAGLAGAARLGRWMPVDIRITNRGDQVDGTLSVTWGDARAIYDVALAAPSEHRYTVYLRTGDVRDAVSVSVNTDQREVASITVPVHLLDDAENLVICDEAAAAADNAHRCAASLSTDALPTSWRGYDTADEVLLGDPAKQTPAQRGAYALWRGLRATELGGVTQPTPAVPEDLRPWNNVRWLLAAYLGALVVIGLAPAHIRRRTTMAFAVIGLVVAGGSLAAAESGRRAPISIRHATVVHEYAGAPDALISMRGVAEFRANDAYALHPANADGSMNVGRAYGAPSAQRFNGDGFPTMTGTFGLGAAQPFQLEVAAPVGALDATRIDTATHLTNIGDSDLHDCELPEGMAPAHVTRLAHGESVDATGAALDADPVVRCAISAPPIAIVDARHDVTLDGTTTLFYHLGAERGTHDSH